MSLRDKILSAPDIQTESVPVPQWDVTVHVKSLTGRQRAILLQEVIDPKGKMDLQKLYPRLVVLSTYDPETGQPVFKEGDMDAVAEKSGAALETIAQVAMKLSGLNPEEAGKN